VSFPERRLQLRYRVIIDGTQISRKEIPEIPHVAIREALLNSFCHKLWKAFHNWCYAKYLVMQSQFRILSNGKESGTFCYA
jgi:hypothetical protein